MNIQCNNVIEFEYGTGSFDSKLQNFFIEMETDHFQFNNKNSFRNRLPFDVRAIHTPVDKTQRNVSIRFYNFSFNKRVEQTIRLSQQLKYENAPHLCVYFIFVLLSFIFFLYSFENDIALR